MKKKNIAIIVPKLVGGGAERIVSYLSIYLQSKYSCYLVVYDSSEIEYDYGGTLISLDIRPSKHLIGKIKNTFLKIRKIRNIKRLHNISITISFLDNPNFINILTKVYDKTIISVRSYKSKENRSIYGRLENFLIKKLYNKSDSIISLSEGVKFDLVENYKIKEEKVKTIYNLCDLEKIIELSKESIEDKYNRIFNGKTIITMGRLTYAKGQVHLIRAFKKVKENIKDARLVIIGKGELESYLKQLVYDLNLEEEVFFLDFHKNPFKFISRAELFVFPSLYEGFGNVIVEAMSCGTTVIASDCHAGPREILGSEANRVGSIKDIDYLKYGVLVPVCDGKLYSASDKITNEEKVLANSIVKLIKDTSLRSKYKEVGKQRVEYFDIKNIVNLWISEIESLL